MYIIQIICHYISVVCGVQEIVYPSERKETWFLCCKRTNKGVAGNCGVALFCRFSQQLKRALARRERLSDDSWLLQNYVFRNNVRALCSENLKKNLAFRFKHLTIERFLKIFMWNLVKHECCINILISCQRSPMPSLHFHEERGSDEVF